MLREAGRRGHARGWVRRRYEERNGYQNLRQMHRQWRGLQIFLARRHADRSRPRCDMRLHTTKRWRAASVTSSVLMKGGERIWCTGSRAGVGFTRRAVPSMDREERGHAQARTVLR